MVTMPMVVPMAMGRHAWAVEDDDFVAIGQGVDGLCRAHHEQGIAGL